MSNDFLSRWSRRKQAATAAPEVPPETLDPDRAEGDPAQTAGRVAEPADVPALQLPDIEGLTPESDVTAFLQAGVPSSLRNAALRRMWSLDPAIRDFVGDARDYAWDWNVPGGVPGTGPLSAEEASGAVREMWRSIGGDPSVVEPPAPEPAVSAGAAEPERGETRPGISPVADVDPARSTEPPRLADVPVTPDTVSDPSATGPGAVTATPMRRHGRARPV